MRASDFCPCVMALAFFVGALTATPAVQAQTTPDESADSAPEGGTVPRMAITTRPVPTAVHHRVSSGARARAATAEPEARPVGPPVPTPAPVAAAPTPAAPSPVAPPTATPLPVRPSRPLALAPERAPAGSDLGWKFLVVFAGAAAALAYWRKRNPPLTLDLGPELRIVRRASIGVRSELLVVDVAGQRHLLGVTPSAVQHLAILDDEDKPAASTAPAPARDEAPAQDTVSRFEAMLESARSESSFAAAPDTARDAHRAPERKRAQTARRPIVSTPPVYGDVVEEQARGLLALGARE